MRLWVLLVLFLLAPAVRAEPGIAVLTNSKNESVSSRATEVKSWLYKLRQKNGLEDFQLAIFTVDMADSRQASEWIRRFEVRPSDLPALAYVKRQGNKVTEVGTLIRSFPDPFRAAQSAFKYAHGEDPSIKVVELLTGLSITSRPEGATVVVDGVEVGLTPAVELPVRAGQIRVELIHPDCQRWQQTVQVAQAQVREIDAELQVLSGALALESEVPMQVWVDGESRGESPLELTGLSPRTLQVRCQAGNGAEVEFTVKVAGGKRTQVRVPAPSLPRRRVASEIVDARGTRMAGRDVNGASYDVAVELSLPRLSDAIHGALSASEQIEICDSQANWDVGLRWRFTAGGQMGKVVGQVELVDRTGARLASFSREKGMPLISFNFSGAAQARAEEIARELVPQVLARLAELPAPSSPGLTPEITIGPLP